MFWVEWMLEGTKMAIAAAAMLTVPVQFSRAQALYDFDVTASPVQYVASAMRFI